jgi:hypothetical protein
MTMTWNDSTPADAPRPGHHSNPTPALLGLIADTYMTAPRALRVSLGADPLPMLTVTAASAPYYGVSTSGTCVQVRAFPVSGTVLTLSVNALTVNVQDNLDATHTATIRGDYLGAVIELRLTYAP